jgi:glycine/D-amino acid oxidase-like deaminating enzyme
VLSDRKGCINSGLLVQQVLAFLERRYPDRFRYVDQTLVDRIVVGAGRGVMLHALGHAISTSRAVLCTNGFVDHTVEDRDGRPIHLHEAQRVSGRVGYMAAFAEEQPRTEAAMSYIRNPVIGGDTPYVYVTRRTYERPAGTVTLTCMGGPEHAIDGQWHADQPFPGAMLSTMDKTVRPFAQAERPARLPYDFQWHGLMGYTDGGVRVIGEHPRHSGLLYNLGCNGVGFLPSICGGERVSRILAGERLPPSIFDPR